MKRSKHGLSHIRLCTLNQGELYPIMVEEVLPGDSFRVASSVLCRVAPLVTPVMHSVDLSVHFWFVPDRLVWSAWEDFITGKNTALVVPTVTLGTDSPSNRLAQSFGIGRDGSGAAVVNALPFRAYNLIWNEYYRDQDLNTPLTVSIGDGPDTVTDYAIRKLSWEKDYFTTARPFPQQNSGTEVVQLSLSGKVPVKGVAGLQTTFKRTDNTGSARALNMTGGGTGVAWSADPGGTGTNPARIDGGLEADLALMTGGSVNMDINEWRKSMAIQRMREHRNRYGSRYRDMLAFLGVRSSDARLQRPEYLGGGKQTISFSEVLSTAETTEAVVGDMAGHGIAALRSRTWKRFFEEHGYVLGFLSARPRTVYMNRVPRTFLRRDYESFWQKELEIMGEQAITNFEVYGDSVTPSDTFGYIPRYDEYRHGEGSVSGEFRNILDMWHMARKFTSQPALNGTFVQCDPTDRIYASTTTDELYCMVANRISARRLVSKRART